MPRKRREPCCLRGIFILSHFKDLGLVGNYCVLVLDERIKYDFKQTETVEQAGNKFIILGASKLF